MSRKHPTRALPLIFLLLPLIAAACGTDDGDESSNSTEPASTEPASTEPASTEPASTEPATDDDGGEGATAPGQTEPSDDAVEPTDFVYASPSPGVNQVPTRKALDILAEKYGHRTEFVALEDSELAVEGVATGQFDMAPGPHPGAALAIQAGAPITFVVEEFRNPWTVVTSADITSCEDLDGARFGLQGPAGTSYSLYQAWLEEECGDSAAPNELYISGSPNRRQALDIGELDATLLHVYDTFDLNDDLTMYAQLANDLPDVGIGVMFANTDWLAENGPVMTQFLEELVRLRQEMANDPQMFADMIVEYMPEMDADTALKSAEAALDAGMFPLDGGLSEQMVNATLDFFRMTEPAAGSITIDGIDVSTLGLAELRSKMAIIPQDPVLFEGPLRYNLDPRGQHDDEALWAALDQASVGDTVRALSGGLSAPVSEGGSNFSVGQRQLLCMARAMLRDARIVVLDEATAAMDVSTDAALQRVIREVFKGTVLTIAHRLDTIADSDYILALDDGKVAEFGPPAELKSNSSGLYHALWKNAQSTGDQS